MNKPNYEEQSIPLTFDFIVKDETELADCKEAARVLMDVVVFLPIKAVEVDADLTPWDRHELGESDDLSGDVVCTVNLAPPESHFGAMFVVRIHSNGFCMRFVKVPTDLVVDVIGSRFSIGKFRYGIMIGSRG